VSEHIATLFVTK